MGVQACGWGGVSGYTTVSCVQRTRSTSRVGSALVLFYTYTHILKRETLQTPYNDFSSGNNYEIMEKKTTKRKQSRKTGQKTNIPLGITYTLLHTVT